MLRFPHGNVILLLSSRKNATFVRSAGDVTVGATERKKPP